MFNLIVIVISVSISAFVGFVASSMASDVSMLSSTKRYVSRRIRSMVPARTLEYLLWLVENEPDNFLSEYREALRNKDEKYRLEESGFQLSRSFSGRCKLIFEPYFFMQCVFCIVMIMVNYFLVRYLVGQSISLRWLITADVLVTVSMAAWGFWIESSLSAPER